MVTDILIRKQKSISKDDRLFYFILNTVLAIILMMVMYPILFVLSSSFSSPDAVAAGKVFVWPVGFSLDGYKSVFKDPNIVQSFINTLIYTVSGTFINVTMTMLAAYPLARKDLPYKGIVMFMFTFTMIFSGGMIPNYILLKDLGMINTIWAMIIPGAIGVYNVIITRTFLQSNIPHELLEAAQMDGCSDFRYFFQIVLPLSKAVVAVITLFYAVGHWNSFFDAFLYLNNSKLYPLQIVLRNILIMNSIDANSIDIDHVQSVVGIKEVLKHALIVVSTIPVLLLYPFVQKYFVKGVMIGSLKG